MRKGIALRWLLLCLLSTCTAQSAPAQELVFQLDAAQSSVDFALDATMHTVHGSFRINAGTLRFDPATGAAAGVFVVDARSAQSGNDSRDRKMHKDVLESAKYPEIRFTVQRFQGKLVPGDVAQVQLAGILTLHGSDHPLTLSAPVQVAGSRATADLRFLVPYVQWGLKDPSNFLLHVSDKVEVHIHAVGTLAPAAPAPRP